MRQRLVFLAVQALMSTPMPPKGVRIDRGARVGDSGIRKENSHFETSGAAVDQTPNRGSSARRPSLIGHWRQGNNGAGSAPEAQQKPVQSTKGGHRRLTSRIK